MNKSAFSDVNTSSWYAAYVEKAKKLGAINGYSDGTFGPNKSITRAESLKILLTLGKGNKFNLLIELLKWRPTDCSLIT